MLGFWYSVISQKLLKLSLKSNENFFKSSSILTLEFSIFSFVPSFKSIDLVIEISAGVTSVKLSLKDLFKDNAEDKMLIVKNSIKHITVIENTVVFILLSICLKTNAFKSFKYIFLLD